MGFRYTALAQAQRLGLSGWIGNRADGSVEGLASGTQDQLEKFHAWLQRGPPASRVARVDWSEADAPSGTGFTIR